MVHMGWAIRLFNLSWFVPDSEIGASELEPPVERTRCHGPAVSRSSTVSGGGHGTGAGYIEAVDRPSGRGRQKRGPTG